MRPRKLSLHWTRPVAIDLGDSSPNIYEDTGWDNDRTAHHWHDTRISTNEPTATARDSCKLSASYP